MWISKLKITAILLYSFYQNPIPEKIQCGNHFREKYVNFRDVNNFHQRCDNKNNILIICKSNNEIFGGFTSLPFSSNDSYGNDNDSFVFLLLIKKNTLNMGVIIVVLFGDIKIIGPVLATIYVLKKIA